MIRKLLAGIFSLALATGPVFGAVGVFQKIYNASDEHAADPEDGGVVIPEGAILLAVAKGNSSISATASDGTNYTLGANSTVGYKFVMKMTAGTNYWFVKSFDDTGHIRIVTPDGTQTTNVLDSTNARDTMYRSYTPTSTGWHTFFVYCGNGAGGVGPDSSPFNLDPYASILWNDTGLTSCTTANRDKWHRLLNDETEGTYLYTSAKGIIVTGSPAPFGTPEPDYGSCEPNVGETLALSCPTAYTNDAQGVAARLLGFSYVLMNGETYVGTAASTSIVYSAANEGSTLTWRWAERYKVSITNATGEAALSLDGGATWFAGTNAWLDADSAQTLTVREDLRRFLKVSGTGAEKASDGSYPFTVTAPMTLVATLAFGGPGVFQKIYNTSDEHAADPEDGGVIIPEGAILLATAPGSPSISATASDGTKYTIGGSSTVGYKFVMKMTAGTNYWFVKNFDDNGHIRIVTPDGTQTNNVLDCTSWGAVTYRSYTPTSTGWHTFFVYCGNGGGGIGPCSAPFNADPYAAILWNDTGLTSCTAENRNQWHRLLNDETEGTSLYTHPKGITVSGSPAPFGTPDPAYGSCELNVGETLALSCPTAYTDNTQGVAARLLGFSYTLVNGEEYVSTASSTSIVWSSANESSTLTWRWMKRYKVSITNATGAAALSLDGGATWFAGTNAWFDTDTALTLTVREDLRRYLEVSGTGAAMASDGSYPFTVTAPMTLAATLQQDGLRRWTADFTAYEYCVKVTNLSGEAVLSDDGGETYASTLSTWVAEGASYTVTAADATDRRVTWANFPAGTTLGERGLSATFPSITCGWAIRAESFVPTHIWTGGAGTTDWDTADNWQRFGDAPPTPAAYSVVYVPAGAAAADTNAVTVSSPFSVAALHVGAGLDEPGGVTLTFSHREENAVSGNIHVYNRAKVTHTPLPGSSKSIDQEVYRVALVAGGGFVLEKEASIDTTACGYGGSKGPGFGTYTAAHGGRLGTTDGPCYGSLVCPTNHGSGADRDRRGGGSVRVAAGGGLIVDGLITADAQWLSGEYHSGSGGSVWLSGTTLTGSGTVRTDGARTSYGSSGSGGRLAVHLSEAADFSAWHGTFSCHGGSCDSGGHSCPGAPGTIYLQAAGQTRASATVIVDNANLSYRYSGPASGYAELDAATESDSFGTLIVRNNGTVRFLPGATYTFSGSLLTHEHGAKYSGVVIATRDVTLAFTGATETVITGTNALPSLRCTVPGKTIRFGVSAEDAFPIIPGAAVTLRGAADNPLVLTGVEDDPWRIAFGSQVCQDIRNVTVNASDASAGVPGMAYASSAGAAANVNWRFEDLPAAGASVTWNGSVSGDWHDARNWTPGRVPVETDAVTVPGTAPVMPTVATNDVTVAALTVESGASLALDALDFTVTGNVRVAGALTAAYRESLIVYGNVDFSGATVTPAEMTLLLTGSAAQTVNLAGVTLHDLVVRKDGGSLTVTGDFSCADLDLRESGALTCLFGAGNTVTCADFRVSDVTLGSTEAGTKWKINVQSSTSVIGIRVSDSEATGLKVFADLSSCETPGREGSNAGWFFGALAQTWTGNDGDGLWTTPLNWEPQCVPGPTSRVVIALSATVTANEAVEVQNLVLGDGSAAAQLILNGTFAAEDGVEVMNGATLTANKPMRVTGNMSVREGGTLTHTALPSSATKITDGVYAVNVTCGGSFNLEAGGAIDVYAKGYASGKGPGYFKSVCGHGGTYYEGYAYGSAVCPTNHGSGEWKAGGGVVRITAGGEARVNGTINAEGDFRTGEYRSSSGGSVWITAARLTGSGSVSVNGSFSSWGSSGSGGRIAVHLTQATDFSDWHGTMTANGGQGCSSGWGPHGPAGTIYLQAAGQTRTNATVIVDNAGRTVRSDGGWTELDASAGLEALGTLIVTNKARVRVKANETLDVYGDWLARGGWMLTEEGACVRFVGPGDHLLTGSNDFCNVSCEVPGATLRFGTTDQDRFTLAEGYRLTWTGSEEEPLALLPYPADAGTWKMCLRTDCRTTVEHVSASNSDARAGLPVLAIESQNLGGNLNWGFSGPIDPGDPIYWTGAGGNSLWTNTENWEDKNGDHRAPIESDSVVIPKPGSEPSVWPVLENGVLTKNRLTVGAGGELTLRNVTLYVTNALTVAGTLKAPGGEATVTVICSNAVDFAGGTFESGLSVFRLEGDRDQTVNPGGCAFHRFEIAKGGGSVTFGAGFSADDLDVLVTDPVTLAFAAGATVTADETYMRGRRTNTEGAVGPLVLASTEEGTAWNLNTTEIHFFSGVDVRDSTATGARLAADAQSRDGGNNVNWVFSDKAFEWTGAEGDGKWETAGNWYPEAVPDASSRVCLTGRRGTSVSVSVSQETVISNLTIGSGLGTVAVKAYAPMTLKGDLEVRTNGTFSVNNTHTNTTVAGNVTVREGGTITHEALPGSLNTVADAEQKGYRLRLSVGGDMTIDAGGAINVYAKGYASGKGPGYVRYKGCAHGGTLVEGLTYGSVLCPTNHGSGYWGGGGGAVQLAVAGDLCVNGTIASEGYTRTGEYYGDAGGSVWLTVARLTGSGTLSVNGANTAWGSAGSGGRLAVYLTQATDFSDWHGKMTANGGKGCDSGWGPHGPAGTIYLQAAGVASGNGAVTVDNAGRSNTRSDSGWTVLDPAYELAGVGSLTLTGKAIGRIGTDNVRRTFKKTTIDVGTGARLDVKSDFYVRDFVLSDSAATLNLDTNTVSVLTTRHKNRRYWAENATVTSVTNAETGVYGKIIWKNTGTVLMMR